MGKINKWIETTNDLIPYLEEEIKKSETKDEGKHPEKIKEIKENLKEMKKNLEKLEEINK